MIEAAQEQLQCEFDEDYKRGWAWKWIEAERYRERVIEVDLQRVLTASGETGLRCQTLVLLCGFATAPLLLSASSARPSEIVLVRSKSMSEGDVADIRKEIEALKEQRFNNGPYLAEGVTIEVVEIDDTDVARAFHTLVGRLSEYVGRDGVIVDVTGGKKTMVGSAFLACSHLGITAQYVDFEKYHSGAQQPVPGTAVIRRLRDPAGVLRLKQRERARRAFEEERFDEAARELGDILGAITGAVADGYILAEEVAALEANRRAAEGATLQAEGRHDEVVRIAFEPAQASRILGELWARTHAEDVRPRRYLKLTESPEFLAWYVGDELWRRARELDRAGEDCRFPFLRAYSVIEMLLVVAMLPQRERVRCWGERAELGKTPNQIAKRPSALLAGLLSRGWWVPAYTGDGRDRARRHAENALPKKDFWELESVQRLVTAEEVESVSFKRNECVHTFGTVGKSDALGLLMPPRGDGFDGCGLAWRMAREVFEDHLKRPALYRDVIENREAHRPPRWRE